MATTGYGESMRIGEVLKSARSRQGLDIRSIEDRTKIRTKYLRALEAEDWDVLPSPAYAKGFLRTYAQVLGLDADAIVDEFREQVESKLDASHPLRLSEPVLEGRRRPPDRRGRRRGPGGWAIAGLVIAAAVGILLVIGLVGDDQRPTDERRSQKGGDKQEQGRKQGDGRGGSESENGSGAPSGPAVLRLTVDTGVAVCLLSGSGEVLIDGQVLSPGTEEQFERDRFELRFPSGYERDQFGLTLDGTRVRLPDSARRAAFEIEPGSPPRELEPPGRTCP